MRTNYHFLSNWVADYFLKSLAQKICLEPNALFNELFLLHVYQMKFSLHICFNDKLFIKIHIQQLCECWVCREVLGMDVSGYMGFDVGANRVLGIYVEVEVGEV